MKNQKTAIRILFFVALLIMCSFGNANAQSTATIKIGTQTWSTKNLDVSTYRNGDAIPQVQDATRWSKLTTGAWCYYENKTENGTTYGKLYNWYAVDDPRGLAPAGWHVPRDAEWTTLVTYLGGASVAGGAMKETGTTHWTSPNSGATNSSGFTGLPAGYRYDDGTFYDVDNKGVWWSTTEYGKPLAWTYALASSVGSILRYGNYEQFGFSVRCLRD